MAGVAHTSRDAPALGLALAATLLGLGLLTGCVAVPAPSPPAAQLVSYEGAPALSAEAAGDADRPTPEALDPEPSPEQESGAPALEPDAPPRRVAVPGDRAVLVLPGAAHAPPRPILYFHGKCGDPEAFQAWSASARAAGTLISLRGEIPCSGGGRTRWNTDPRRVDQRVRAAIAAVEADTGRALVDPPIVFGYSQGALVAEALAARYPDRYSRAVLAAGPRAPRAPGLRALSAVLLLAGELDTRHHLVAAADELARRGVRARYLELPGARHGHYGPQAEARIAEGLAWLSAMEKL